MSDHPLPLIVTIYGHHDIPLTIEPDAAAEVFITTPDGHLLANMTLSNTGAPHAILGHWPEAEEWVEEAAVSLVHRPAPE